MIRILHTADIHLGVETYGFTKDNGINSRISDYLHMLDSLVSVAVTQNFDAFLIAGDIFENERPTNYVVTEFSKRIRNLLDGGVVVLITPGNHETSSSARVPSVLEIIKALRPSKNDNPDIACHVIGSQPKTPGDLETLGSLDLITTRSGLLQVLAMPYPRRSEILTSEELKNQKTREEAKNLAAVKFLDRTSQLASKAKKDLPSIFVGHFGVKEAQMQPGRMGYLAEDVVFSAYDVMWALSVSKATFTYIALGHYHNPQMPTPNLTEAIELEDLDGDVAKISGINLEKVYRFSDFSTIEPPEANLIGSKKPVQFIPDVYSGSPARRDFTDGTIPRKYVDVEVSENDATIRFEDIDSSRSLRQLTLQTHENWQTQLEEKFTKSSFWGRAFQASKNGESAESIEKLMGTPLPIFRLKIPDSARPIWPSIRKWLESLNMFEQVRMYCQPAQREVKTKIISVAESPAQAVERYIKSQDDSFYRENREAILHVAQEILGKSGAF
jgi:exonuclease SbcD